MNVCASSQRRVILAPVRNQGRQLPMAIEPRDQSGLHQTIGSLNAKADQAQRDFQEIRGDLRSMEVKQDALLGEIEQMMARHIKPHDDRLAKIEATVTEVQATVIKWKTYLSFISVVTLAVGATFSYLLNARKLFGFGN
jgi:hypothetical protein